MRSALSSTTHKCCFSEKKHILHSEFRGQFNLTKNIEEHKKKRNGEEEKPTGGVCVGFFGGEGRVFLSGAYFSKRLHFPSICKICSYKDIC